MEVNEGNLQALAGYLQKTLSPDPVERRGGNYIEETHLSSWQFCQLVSMMPF